MGDCRLRPRVGQLRGQRRKHLRKAMKRVSIVCLVNLLKHWVEHSLRLRRRDLRRQGLDHLGEGPDRSGIGGEANLPER